jgi:hypothetical protein
MKKTILTSFATLFTLTAVASADERNPEAPPTGANGTYLSFGYEYTSRPNEGSSALFIDGGHRLRTSPLFVHGRVTTGATAENGLHSDDFEQLRVGPELRGCIFKGLVCSFAGLDVGIEHRHDERMSKSTGIVVPRTGLELGTPFRFRFSVEAPISTGRATGTAGSFSVGYSF